MGREKGNEGVSLCVLLTTILLVLGHDLDTVTKYHVCTHTCSRGLPRYDYSQIADLQTLFCICTQSVTMTSEPPSPPKLLGRHEGATSVPGERTGQTAMGNGCRTGSGWTQLAARPKLSSRYLQWRIGQNFQA